MITIFIFLLYHMFLTKSVNTAAGGKMLFDFTKDKSLGSWIESSDTVREVGMSKATLTMQKTQIFQRAVFFTMLNPQQNGAGFAGMNYHSNWNLSSFSALELHLRAQGQNQDYKIVLRHRNENREPFPTYEQTFTAPTKEFATINLPLSDFQPYYRGKLLNDSEPLDKSYVTSIGLQIYGGVYLPKKQSGVSALEIDWIKAV